MIYAAYAFIKDVSMLKRINFRKIKAAVKAFLCVSLSAAVSVGTLSLFGDQIAGSAYKYTFKDFETDLLSLEYGVTGKKDTQDNIADSDEFMMYKSNAFVQEEDTEVQAPLDAAQTSNDSQTSVSGTPAPVTDNPDAVVVNLSALSGKYKTYGGTSVINNTKYDVTGLLYASYTPPVINKEEPYILIYHTHTSEEYYGGGSVVDVGNAMAEEFERLGYKTIHLTEVYDKEQFSGAYSRSIKGVEQMLEKYPSIKLCFDVHRDSITTQSGDTYRPLTQIDNNNCAQVMLVCGTDSKGLKHPNWRENFKFALDISRTMGGSFGALSRPVNLRADRFNTHVTDYTVLMEVGSAANTLEEAKNAAVYTARSVIKTIE